eukprot:6805361-Alexandrium_andersonii.AAC.1
MLQDPPLGPVRLPPAAPLGLPGKPMACLVLVAAEPYGAIGPASNAASLPVERLPAPLRSPLQLGNT